MTAPVIEVRELSHRYGSRRALDNVSLGVEPGQVFGFLGPNGAGKSTTIRILLGLLKPTHGHARILGHDCWTRSPWIKQQTGYLPGDLRLYPWMTLRSGLRIWGRVRGLNLEPSGGELAERLLLEPELPVRDMSRGTRQKLGIVLAMAHRPRLLLLDEPTSGLDPLIQIELGKCLRQRSQQGDAVFFSSHTLSEVEQLCDHVALVRRGRLVVNQPLHELRRQASRQVTIEFSSVEAARQAPPDWLQCVRVDGPRWDAQLRGDAQQLVRWAAAQPLADLSVGPPQLESMFRGYYELQPGLGDADGQAGAT